MLAYQQRRVPTRLIDAVETARANVGGSREVDQTTRFHNAKPQDGAAPAAAASVKGHPSILLNAPDPHCINTIFENYKMNFREKARQIFSISRHSKRPLPLLLDLLRTKRADYIADCKGFEFELKAHRHEWYAVYETIINEDYLQQGVSISPGDTIVDVGAGFGTFALLAARKAGPGGQVIAYEPDPDICARAQRNASRNGLHNVRMTNEAVGGANEEAELFLQPHSHRNTIFPRIDDQQARTDRTILVQKRSIISVIDAIDGPINFLKVHCEGCEYQILDNLDEERSTKIRQIALEVHRIDGRTEQELIDRLAALNFRPVYKRPMIFAVRADA